MSSQARARTATSAYRRFCLAGFDSVTAGNLTALSVGLTPMAAGWRPRELEQLLFVAWLDRSGRVRP
jgi:hypothetical protein